MKTKIPLPILALLMIGLVFLSSLLIGSLSFDYQALLSILLVIAGLSCALPSFRLFTYKKTTIAPFLLPRRRCF